MTGEVRWGTSTWTYEGWQGIVYEDVARYGKAFNRDSLGEYARSGRFGCVGIDSTFYRPPSVGQLAGYAALLPPGFECVIKAWQHLTAPFFTKHFGPKDKIGEPNPLFLDPRTWDHEFLPAFREAFREHTGAFVLEFPIVPPRQMGREEAIARLDAFLGEIEPGWPMSVEVRSQWWLGHDYFEMLARHGAAHAFNVWTRMPLPHEVLALYPQSLGTASFSVCRALVAPGQEYAAAVKKYQPYDRLQTVRPEVRRSLIDLAKAAMQRDVKLLISVNNRLEGCAPLTIDQVRAQLELELAHPTVRADGNLHPAGPDRGDAPSS
jgi:uncharacterized protein YecE (DUF72 family)